MRPRHAAAVGFGRLADRPSVADRRRWLRAALVPPLASALPGLYGRSALASDVPAIIAAAKPSIVAIGVAAPLQTPQFRFVGSGFVVDNGLRIVTCAHVVPTLDAEKRESIAIAVPGGESARLIRVRIAALHRDSDVAVLEFDGPPLPALRLAETAEVREGTDVVLMGFPLGGALGLFAATHRGIIAAITPMIVPAASSSNLRSQSVNVMRGAPIQLLQLDATSFPGNSGGPLMDAATGRVLGIVSLGLAKGTRESAIQHPTGISYAVPVRYVAAALGPR